MPSRRDSEESSRGLGRAQLRAGCTPQASLHGRNKAEPFVFFFDRKGMLSPGVSEFYITKKIGSVQSSNP